MKYGSEEWTHWLDRHGASLVLFARQWVTDRADAEDVVQNAFVRFWRSRERVADPTAYLYGCVKNCALELQRSASRRTRREKMAARPESETLFLGTLEAAERGAAIEEALIQLPENQREVLVMRIWGGLTFPQIAAASKISADTAASRYRYALTRLREQLAEESIR